jgi:lysine 2,3-aminomutase
MEQQDDLSNDGQQLKTEQAETADPPLPSSEKTKSLKSKYYPNISHSQWNDWKWQISNSITSYRELQRIFGSSDELSEDMNLPLRITPFYASLITNLNDSIGKCVIPTNNELIIAPNEENDSLHEEHQSPVECIVHRYPDRVLFLTTDFCSSNCRYCCRSRMVSHKVITKTMWEEGFHYIENHKEIRDIIISGGDPLTLSDKNIEYILNKLRNIKHVEIIRIGSKVPIVLPMRITDDLINILKKFHPLYINIHIIHPNELSLESKIAILKLANIGIPLGSQTVLLKNVNDNTETMKKLMHELLKVRIKPYYIYQADLISGTSHFRTSIKKGIKIMSELQGWTSGLAVPKYIIDSPLGKIDMSAPYNIQSVNKNIYYLKSYSGKVLRYEDKLE